MNISGLFSALFFNKEVYSQSILLRKNDLAFRVSIIFLVFALPYIGIFYYLGWTFANTMVMLTVLLYGLSIILNKLNCYSTSKTILIVGTSVSFFICANILGDTAGAQFLLFALIPLPLLLFEYNQVGWISACIIAPIGAYFLLESGHYSWIPYIENVNAPTLFYIRQCAILTTFLLLILSVGTYFVSNRRYELKLEKKNDELKRAFEIERDLRLKSEFQAEEIEKSNALVNSLAHQATLGAVIRGIVHEVKEPLTAIRACCSLILMEENLTHPVKDSVNNMLDYIKNLGELVRTLLADSGAVMWMDSPINLGRVVDQVLRLADNEGFIRNIHFEKSIPDNLPVVKGGPAYISQALLNLLLNALRFSPDGSQIRVTVKVENPWVNIYVSDSGPGINPTIKDTLFEQGITTSTSGDSHVGLGLYFVKRVMDAHNGTVAVHTSSDLGSTFVMALPIWTDPVAATC